MAGAHSPATSLANSAPISILAYCASSILMTVTNKMVLSHFDFNMNFLLLSIQGSVAIVLLWVFKKAGLISFRRLDLDEARKWMPISLGLVCMIYSASKSLQYLSIPVYSVWKNLTIILIAYGEVLWFNSKVTPIMLLSFVLMVLSSVIAGWSDFSSFTSSSPNDLIQLNIGYIWMAINCLSSAGYVLYMRKRIKLFNFKDFDTVYYNNMLSLPVMLVLSLTLEGWTSGELGRTFSPDVRSALITAAVLSGVSSFLISYGSAWCVRCTSSTTYSMIGALNKLPVAASGILFLGDPATASSIFGILFGFFAGLLYSYSKTDQAQRNLALANGSTLSNSAVRTELSTSALSDHGGTTTSASEGDLLELVAPTNVAHKGGHLPLYNANPDGKSAD
ncbi:GDP-mannose transporter into the lumen of the Golgi [Mortierella claussenii]|nr:GDP-mannose transporter into the lumen of the Golgi [Mortierella claussenii]